MNEVSPSTLNSKLIPYKNYARMVPNKNHTSQKSCKANSEIVGDKSNKELFINPYTKVETVKLVTNSLSKPNSFYNNLPKSSTASENNNSKNISEQRSPIKNIMHYNVIKDQNNKESKNSSKHKSKHRSRERDGSIESAEDIDFNPVYIDTGGSNMQ